MENQESLPHAALSEADIKRAREWVHAHNSHVLRLIAYATTQYPPSGSDRHHPELWKPAMWLWFVTRHQP